MKEEEYNSNNAVVKRNLDELKNVHTKETSLFLLSLNQKMIQELKMIFLKQWRIKFTNRLRGIKRWNLKEEKFII